MFHRFMRGAACLAAVVLLARAAAAQDVTLTSRDGTLAVSGTFQTYDGEVFRVMTDYGLLTVDGEGVVCDGPACPDLTAFVARVRIVAEAGAGRRVLDPLLAAFATANGYDLTRDGTAFVLTAAEGGQVIARFSFEPRNPQAVVQALRLGLAEIGLGEMESPGLAAQALGFDALVAVVSPDNPIRSMTTGDLERAWTGQVTNWRQVGGPDMPLVVHALTGGSGFRLGVESRLGRAAAQAEQHETKAALDDAVARDPWALAVTAAGSVAAARVLTLTDSCGFVLSPDDLAVRARDYPLTQPFLLLTPKRRLPLIAREFLEFAGSAGAGPAIAAAGLTGREPSEDDLPGDGQRLINAIRVIGPEVPAEAVQRLALAMTGATRLSLTFRYGDDGRTMDAASVDDLAQLIRLIETGSFGGMEMLLASFSEGSGDAAENLALSQQRADAVLDAVATAVPDLGDMGVSLRSLAFGESLPLACDESPAARHLNRRVEVWLRPFKGNAAP